MYLDYLYSLLIAILPVNVRLRKSEKVGCIRNKERDRDRAISER
jgi:hypothetical protein